MSLAPSRTPQKPRGLDSCSPHVGMHAGASVHPVQTITDEPQLPFGQTWGYVRGGSDARLSHYLHGGKWSRRPPTSAHTAYAIFNYSFAESCVHGQVPIVRPIPFSQKNIPKNMGPRTLSYYLTLAPPPPASPLFSSDKPSSPGSDFYIVQQPPKQPTSKLCLSIPSLLPLARQRSSQLGKFHVYFRLVPPTIHRPGDFARAGARFPAVQRFTQDLLCFGCFFVRGGQSVRVSNVDPVDRPRSRAIPLPAQLPHLDRAGHVS